VSFITDSIYGRMTYRGKYHSTYSPDSTESLNVLKWGLTLEHKLHSLVFLEYLSCPSEISIALRRIPRAIKGSKRDGMTSRCSKYIVQPVIELRHIGSEGGVDNVFGENVINLVTIESKGVNHLWKQIQRCCVYFL